MLMTIKHMQIKCQVVLITEAQYKLFAAPGNNLKTQIISVFIWRHNLHLKLYSNLIF